MDANQRMRPAVASCLPDVSRLGRHVSDRTTDMAASTRSVPLDFYRDENLWTQEVEALRRTPLVVATSGALPRNGAYATRSVLSSALLITRDLGGKVHVFANSCRHRGAKIANGEGATLRHTCPYHGWTYAADGALAGAPCREGFSDLEPGELGLIEYPSEERHGLVFAVLDTGAACDLDRHLGAFDAELAGWNYAGLSPVGAKSLAVPANWKAGVEAFSETYHLPLVHRKTVGDSVLPNVGAAASFGRHYRLMLPGESFDPSQIGGGAHPSDHRRRVVTIYWLYPNMILVNDSIGTQCFNILPGSDVGELQLDYSYLTVVDSDNLERTRRLEDIVSKMWELLGEDAQVLASVRQATRHSPAPALIIGKNEPCVQHVYEVLNALV